MECETNCRKSARWALAALAITAASCVHGYEFVLRRGGVETATAAVGKSTDVKGAHGIRVIADTLLEDEMDGDFDAVILPGGAQGTENLKNSDATIALLRRQKEEGRLICAICAAPLVLVEAGVLEPDQHVTCYPTCVIDMDRDTANVPVVADGIVITGQAPGSAMLFSLVVLQTLTNENVASKIARGLVTDVLD